MDLWHLIDTLSVSMYIHWIRMYTVFQKNVITSSMITWTIIVRLQQFLAHSLTESIGHRQLFYFPTLPISPHSSRIRGGPCAQSGGQAKKGTDQLVRFHVKLMFSVQCSQDNSPCSPAQKLQTALCSSVVWSQSHLPSHSLINNLIVCNKSCYCFIINRKLNNK